MQSVQYDDAVVAMVGSPVVGGEVSEYRHVRADHADLSFVVSGPKGKANVHARMTLQAGVWQMSTLELEGN